MSSRSNSNGKNTNGTLRASRISRNGSTKSDTRSASPMEKLSSPAPKPRLSVDRSPRLVDSKIPIKNGTSPDKLPQAAKASQLQEKLEAIEVDLQKAREQLASVEQEKIKAVEELNEAKRSAAEMNEKLQEATAARAKAEESLETERFRITEMEQAGKETALKREEEFYKELENARSQHDQDVSAMNSMAQELERIKTELEGVTAAKEIALGEADEAKKTVRLHEEKADRLSEEVSSLKGLHDSALGNVQKETQEKMKKLEDEVTRLKHELERRKVAQVKLVQMEALVEKLQKEVADARKGESDASMLANEWRQKAEKLRADLEENYRSEKSASGSLAVLMEQLEESRSLIEDAETEISLLERKINSLEMEVSKQKKELEESDRQLDLAQQDALNIGRTVELLKLELKNLEDEKLQAVNSERVVASKLESLTEEHNKLLDELKVLNISKDEGDKSKKEVEDLAAKLQAMSTESREKEERLSRMQAEIEESQKEIEHLNLVSRNTEERYEVMLDEARYEIVCLKKVVERLENGASEPDNEWDANAKELNFINTIAKLEEEVASLKTEMAKLVNSQKEAKPETHETNGEAPEMLTEPREVESGPNSTSEEAEESQHEGSQSNGAPAGKENGLQSVARESEDLHTQEAPSLHRGRHLSALFKQDTVDETQQKNEASNGVGEYKLERGSSEVAFKEFEDHHQGSHNQQEEDIKETKNGKVDHLEAADNGLALERDHEGELNDDDAEAKMNGSDISPTDGTTGSVEDESISPSKQNQHQRKKKALLHKFGNLLKKGNHQ